MIRPVRQSIVRFAYGIWAWLALSGVTAFTALGLALTPSLATRRRVARRASRALFRLCAIPLVVELPEGALDKPCVVVANHASYLDGIILTAALPARFCFVIKREVTGVPLMHFVLRRLGSEFVERFDRHRGAVDARRILRKADAGESLAFFPEGTFHREPGVGRFRTGAFAAAVRGDLPVVPVSIRGARQILPSGAVLPRRGRLVVTAHPALERTGNDRNALVDLRDRSRSVIVAASGEPDLESSLESA